MTAAGRALLFAVLLGLNTAHSPSRAAETRLIDQFGRPLDSHQLQGRWLLVYFGYASCKEICPAALTAMSALLERLGPLADSIEPLFVTLDPAHDSPEIMRAFIAHFDPRIRALTGTPESVAEAARAFDVPWRRSAAADVADHGTLFYVVAPDGRVVQILHPQQPVADLLAAVRGRLSTRAAR